MTGYAEQSQPDWPPEPPDQPPSPFEPRRQLRDFKTGSAGAGRHRPDSRPDSRSADSGWADSPDPTCDGDEAWAMLAYLTAAIAGFVPPAAIYLLKMRSSPFVRAHAAQAVNFAVTMMLYTVSALIVGAMLALDSVNVALLIAGGAAILLWLVALTQVTRAALAASGGSFYRIPGWLCAPVLRR